MFDSMVPYGEWGPWATHCWGCRERASLGTSVTPRPPRGRGVLKSIVPSRVMGLQSSSVLLALGHRWTWGRWSGCGKVAGQVGVTC